MAVNLMEALGAAEEATQDQITIYIPSRDLNGEAVKFEVWVEKAMELLSRIGGGATRMPPAQGAWRNPGSGALIIEDVVLVYAFTDGDALSARLTDLRRFLHGMGRALDQGEVAIEVNDNFYKIRTFATPEETTMGRLLITDKPKPRLEIVEPRTRRRITVGEIVTGLGAEHIASIPSGGSPMSAFALRLELFRRLRSTGGRPGLDGADMKPKIPMRRSSWRKLEQIAKQVETADFHPTPAQLASVILDAAIDGFDLSPRSDEDRVERLKHE